MNICECASVLHMCEELTHAPHGMRRRYSMYSILYTDVCVV